MGAELDVSLLPVPICIIFFLPLCMLQTRLAAGGVGHYKGAGIHCLVIRLRANWVAVI